MYKPGASTKVHSCTDSQIHCKLLGNIVFKIDTAAVKDVADNIVALVVKMFCYDIMNMIISFVYRLFFPTLLYSARQEAMPSDNVRVHQITLWKTLAL
jgi:hypothetical protein